MLSRSPIVSPSNPRPFFQSLSLTIQSQSSSLRTKTQSRQSSLAVTCASSSSSSPSFSSPINSKRSDQSDALEEVLDAGEADRIGEEATEASNGGDKLGMMKVGAGNPSLTAPIGILKMSLGDRAFLLMAFIAITTTVAFTSLVAAAIPTLFAMKRAAISLAKLADIAREELPSTMAAVRLSGMEISDLTLELSDLSQEISEGVNKSTQAVRAAEAGIKQMGAIAHQKTMSIIEERANLPDISIQPFVAGAAKKTSRYVGKATKNLMHFFSGEGESKEIKKPSIES